MGPSGSGKSTLLNLIGCLDRPSNGKYYLGGHDVATLDDNELSAIRGRHIVFVFQSFNLISQLNVLENIEVPMFYQGMSEHQSKVSFAKVPGAGSSAPVEKTPVQEVQVVGGNPANDTRVAAPTTQTRGITTFSSGEDEDDGDRSDVRLPRLNIVQGMSGQDLKRIGCEGTLVLKKTLALPQGLRIVVAGCSKKRYAEKTPEFGKGTPPRVLDTLEEVIQAGGTDQWRQSRENKDKEGIPLSRKPWFTPMVTSIILIQKPTKAQCETVCAAGKPGTLTDAQYAAIEEHFSAVSEDGVAFAAAAYTVKSTSFGGFYVPLKSEQVTGVLKHGFFCRYVKLSTKEVRAFEPAVEILDEVTSEGVRKLARSVLS